MRIYLISGYLTSGKTTVAKMMAKYIPNSKLIGFADMIKDAAAEKYNFPRSLCDTQEGKVTLIPNVGKTVRELLIKHGWEEKNRTNDPQVWAKKLVEKIRPYKDTDTVYVIHDWRFQEELACLRLAFPLTPIHQLRVSRSSVKPIDDMTEHALDKILLPTMHNEGTVEDLEEMVKRYLGLILN